LAYLTNCRWLNQLDLAGTKLTDNSIAAVAFPPLLADLSVANTAIRGTGLGGLCKVKQLRSLNLSGSNVDDDGLQTIAGIPSLERLELSHCVKITDAGVRHLAKLSNLTELDLRGTKTSDAALAALATMPNLRRLKLRETLVTKRGVEQLSPSLKMLEADEASPPPSQAPRFSRTRAVPSHPFRAI
jgi:Leucine-rich repeat (LRR) protein